MKEKKLSGRRIAILAADGFEKLELTIPRKALLTAGAEVDVISLRSGNIRGMNLHEPAGKVKVDRLITEAHASEYDGLLIPGGFINPDLLRQSEEVRKFVKEFNERNLPIASLCHGPWVLASSGLLDGRTLTSWPGIRDDLVHAGAKWVNEELVRDGNFLTSRGPEDLKPFVKGLLDHFSGEAALVSTSTDMRTSAPQAKEAPALVLKAFTWFPRPSFRTVGIAGVLALGILGLRSKKAY